MIDDFIKRLDHCKVLHYAEDHQLNHTFTVGSYIFSMTTQFDTNGTIITTKLYFTKLNDFYQELDPNDECAKQLLECVANRFGDEMISECIFGSENYAKFIDEYAMLTYAPLAHKRSTLPAS